MVAQTINAVTAGAVGDGVTDNATIVQSLLNTLGASGGKLYFPSGTFIIRSAISFTIAARTSVVIVGDGQQCTILGMPNGNTITVNYTDQSSSYSEIDLTHRVDTSSPTSVALKLVLATPNPNPAGAAPNNFQRVTFFGGYGLSHYWGTAVSTLNVSNINFDGVTFDGSVNRQGVGVDLESSSGGNAVVFNFDRCFFYFNSIGINYGNGIQGVTVSQSNFTGGSYGIVAPTGATSIGQLCISGCQFNVFSAAVNLQSNTGSVLVATTLFILSPSTYGIIGIMNNFAISACSFTGNAGTFGIVANAGSSIGTITGNTFSGCNTGVTLNSGSSYINVQSNEYIGCVSSVGNSGTGNTIGGSSP